MCVREDLVEAGSPAAQPFWCDCGSGHPVDAAAWGIQEGLVGDVMPMGTIVASVGSGWPVPTTSPVMNVLKIDLPVVAEGPGQTFVPALSSLVQPPAETPPLRAWQMLIPYTMVDDEILTPQQSAEQSPLYLLERQVFFKLIDHFHNTTAINQESPPLTITSGVETTESETFSQSTGISITASAGIELRGFSAGVSTTVTQEFGYSSQTSVTELLERSRTVTMTTRPNHATAIWPKMTRFVLYRHDGTQVESVASWDIGEDSHVLDEFPDD
jgi:hypothetical protein